MRAAVTVSLLFVVCLLLEGGESFGFDRRHSSNRRHNQPKRKTERKHGHHHHHHHDMTLQHPGDNLTPVSDNGLQIHMVKMGWLNVPTVVGCRCHHHGAICIRGPDGKPTCVQKHHLRESARLFKHYHEMKEKAEEDLNEIDPPPHPSLPHTPHDSPHHAPHNTHGQPSAPHDVHISAGRTSGVPQSEEKRKQTLTQHHASPQCDSASMDEMRRRLTGWFHLLHTRERHLHHHGNQHGRPAKRHLSVKKELREGEGCQCFRSVLWEFHQLDADKSHDLSRSEVKVIDNNDREPCLHPYLLTCDLNQDGRLTQREWCCCFPKRESESPCYTRLDEIENSKDTEQYIPSCDKEGFYHKEQCQGGLARQTCWCVTPTGSQIPGTQTKGRAHCSKVDYTGQPQNES